MLSDRCPVLSCHVCNVGVLWPNGWMDGVGKEVGLGPGDTVLDGDPAISPHGKGHSSPHFSTRFALARSTISATAELLLVYFSIFLPVYGSTREIKLTIRRLFSALLNISYRIIFRIVVVRAM